MSVIGCITTIVAVRIVHKLIAALQGAIGSRIKAMRIQWKAIQYMTNQLALFVKAIVSASAQGGYFVVVIGAASVGVAMTIVQTGLLIVGMIGHIVDAIWIGFVIVKKGTCIQNTDNPHGSGRIRSR